MNKPMTKDKTYHNHRKQFDWLLQRCTNITEHKRYDISGVGAIRKMTPRQVERENIRLGIIEPKMKLVNIRKRVNE